MDSSITDSNSMPDVQGYEDTRRLAITRVGIKRIKAPVIVTDRPSEARHTVAEFDMSVHLPDDRKGTHMSRFTQLLNDNHGDAYSIANMARLHQQMLERLDSDAGTLRLTFPYFIEKFAPVTGQPGMMDYQIALQADTAGNSTTTTVEVSVPVTTLCPCSKEISRYGAHSQRSMITIAAVPQSTDGLYWEDLITDAEAQASAPLYSQLKRADEKFVTEHAYENPRFVEDLIRDVATVLNANRAIKHYDLEVENFESIHNHSAWARIARD